MARATVNNIPEDVFLEFKRAYENKELSLRDIKTKIWKEYKWEFSPDTIRRYISGIVPYKYKKPVKVRTDTKQAKAVAAVSSVTASEYNKEKAQANKAAESKTNHVMETDRSEKLQAKVSFQPNEGPQTEFLSAPETDVLFGGAAGGGKSVAMIVDPLRYCYKSRHKALILRRTLKELRQLIDLSREYYPMAFPGAKFKEAEKIWVFPSGAKIEFGYLEKDADVYQYQGQDYSWIGFDEITQLPTEFPWHYLSSRLRTADPEIECYMRCCVDEGDVLTESGWKDIKQISVGESVYSVSTLGITELKKVTGVHEYYVEEPLVRYYNKGLYISMTDDHRVLYTPIHNRKDIRLSHHNSIQSKRFNILRAGDYDQTGLSDNPLNIDVNLYLQLLGIYLAEGSINHKPHNGNYKVIITQKKEQTKKEICSLLDQIGINYCIQANGDIQITSKLWWEYFKQFGYSHEKFIPRIILQQASRHQLYLLFDWMMRGDGYWQSNTSGGYYTSSKQLNDDVAELVFKLGWRVSQTHKTYDNPKWRDKYTTHFMVRNYSDIDKTRAKYENYTGKVYCLTVEDNETFVIRQRGKVWVSGNTANPGGPGSTWVKARYLNPAEPNTTFIGSDGISRRFIPSLLKDNPYLYADGRYQRMLESLPEVQRKQLLEGNWDVTENQAFPEFKKDVHVIQPFHIPNSWQRMRGVDYGYRAPSAVIWVAIDPSDGTMIVYRELYKRELTGSALGSAISDAEREEVRQLTGVVDWAVFNKTGYTGPTIGETLNRPPYNLKLRAADKNRKAGKVQIHERLKLSDAGRPKLQIFSSCVNLIKELSSLEIDKTDPEDVNTHMDDHAYDALRYICMSRPITTSFYDRIYKIKRDTYTAVDPIFGY